MAYSLEPTEFDPSSLLRYALFARHIGPTVRPPVAPPPMTLMHPGAQPGLRLGGGLAHSLANLFGPGHLPPAPPAPSALEPVPPPTFLPPAIQRPQVHLAPHPMPPLRGPLGHTPRLV